MNPATTDISRSFKINPTRTTPLVLLDHNQQKLQIRGRSSPASSVLFYGKVMHAVNAFFQTGRQTLRVYIMLEYFNTSTSKCLYDLLKNMKTYKDKEEMNIDVHWYYEIGDEDMKETGEDYMDVLKMSFYMHPYRPRSRAFSNKEP